jgi:SAM-dependent methyltransferase
MRPLARQVPPASDFVIWHDVECGGYSADLPLWEELAMAAEGPILELGCGTGRVGLHLARCGHEVTGLDTQAELVDAFNARANGLAAQGLTGDARDFDLGAPFALILAPMQVLQLLAGPSERVACLTGVAAHLEPGGVVAVAIVEQVPSGVSTGPEDIVPDAREVDGHLYASLPLETGERAGEVVIRRQRKRVSPAGDLLESLDEVRLRTLAAADVEGEGEAVGLRAAGRRRIPATEDHLGSTVVLFERGR